MSVAPGVLEQLAQAEKARDKARDATSGSGSTDEQEIDPTKISAARVRPCSAASTPPDRWNWLPRQRTSVRYIVAVQLEALASISEAKAYIAAVVVHFLPLH